MEAREADALFHFHLLRFGFSHVQAAVGGKDELFPRGSGDPQGPMSKPGAQSQRDPALPGGLARQLISGWLRARSNEQGHSLSHPLATAASRGRFQPCTTVGTSHFLGLSVTREGGGTVRLNPEA